jgi:hypothetical protein
MLIPEISNLHESIKVDGLVRSPSSGYDRPYCYELTFIGSILKKIGSGVECK